MATVSVLVEGYIRRQGQPTVASTCSLVRSGDLVVVVDPGFVARRDDLLDALAEHDVGPEDVTDIVLSHHHPDHTVNVALLAEDARIHDHWATYLRDEWHSRDADGFHLADDVWLWATPGHTPQDVSTLVDTDDGLVALTHLWVDAATAVDHVASDPAQLRSHRARLLDAGVTTIVPGHGPAFAADRAPRWPDDAT